jgi:Ca2+-binding EF-hand superfamily protein
LDNLSNPDSSQAKKIIADQLMRLKLYENNFQQSYPINIFIDTKSDEIFNIFDSNNNGAVNLGDLKQLMVQFAPKYIDTKWDKWK